jgi:hypothetical protein
MLASLSRLFSCGPVPLFGEASSDPCDASPARLSAPPTAKDEESVPKDAQSEQPNTPVVVAVPAATEVVLSPEPVQLAHASDPSPAVDSALANDSHEEAGNRAATSESESMQQDGPALGDAMINQAVANAVQEYKERQHSLNRSAEKPLGVQDESQTEASIAPAESPKPDGEAVPILSMPIGSSHHEETDAALVAETDEADGVAEAQVGSQIEASIAPSESPEPDDEAEELQPPILSMPIEGDHHEAPDAALVADKETEELAEEDASAILSAPIHEDEKNTTEEADSYNSFNFWRSTPAQPPQNQVSRGMADDFERPVIDDDGDTYRI